MLNLEELLLTYAIVQGAYAFVCAFLWYVSPHRAYRYQFLLCVGLTLNFITQKIFADHHLFLALSLGIYFICSLSLVQILLTGLDMEVPIGRFVLLLATMVLASMGLHWEFQNFTFTAIPMALSVAYPMIFYGGKVLRNWSEVSYAHRFYAFLIIINGIHFLDYPFFRLDPQASLVGFTMAFGMALIFSIFLPVFITNELRKSYQKKLENEVFEKTQHLNSTLLNLRDAFSQLKESKEEKSQLVNVLCHDLATPLNGMSLLLQKVSREEESPEISRLRKLMKHVITILGEVREMRAHESGKRELELSKVQFEELAENIHSLFDEQLKEKNLKFNVIHPAEAPTTFFSDSQVLTNNILSNLISNAIKFSPPGGEVDLGIEKTKNETICLFVRDFGEGLSQGELEKIQDRNFKPFQGTSGEKGFGLGLSIMSFYLQKLGGSFRIESRTPEEAPEAHGTTVYLFF